VNKILDLLIRTRSMEKGTKRLSFDICLNVPTLMGVVVNEGGWSLELQFSYIMFYCFCYYLGLIYVTNKLCFISTSYNHLFIIIIFV
jgi:hypothetical protein